MIGKSHQICAPRDLIAHPRLVSFSLLLTINSHVCCWNTEKLVFFSHLLNEHSRTYSLLLTANLIELFKAIVSRNIVRQSINSCSQQKETNKLCFFQTVVHWSLKKSGFKSTSNVKMHCFKHCETKRTELFRKGKV